MKHKKIKRELHSYVRENLSRGHSLESIKKAFIMHGYDLNFVDRLIRTYRLQSILIKAIPALLILFLVVSIYYFIIPNIIGYTTITKESNFTDNLGLTVNENSGYTWNLTNKGLLKSVTLNGEVKNSGTAKVYLQHENNSYLIFDSKKLENKGLEEITLFVVKEIKVEITGNLTVEGQTIIDNLIGRINTTKNDVKIEIKVEENQTKTDVDGDVTNEQSLLIDGLINTLKNTTEKIKIKIKSGFEEIKVPEEIIDVTPPVNETPITNVTMPINETNATEIITNETIGQPINETALNETSPVEVINATPVLNETFENISINRIGIKLEYKKDTVYDKDDNGIENINGVIDLTVENTGFSWEANKENLCTRWDVYSVENEESTIVCYGGSRCCNFVGLLPTRKSWDEPFYLAYGQHGAALDNTVSAQVIYVDYNLSLAEPYTEIYYSDWKNLTAKFYEGFTRFEDICIETCILTNLNSTSYRLVFEIDNSSLILDSIKYRVESYETINNAPVLLKNFSDISILEGQSYTLNLNEYFYDLDNDTLMFNYYSDSEIGIAIANETAVLSSNNFTGVAYIFFMANDSVDTATSNIFKVEVKERKVASILKSLRQLIGLG